MKNLLSRKKAVTVTAIIFFVFLIIPISIGMMYYRAGETIKNRILLQFDTEGNIAASALQVKLNRLTEIASSLATNPSIVSAATLGSWNNAANTARDIQNNVSFYDQYIDRVVFTDKTAIEKSAYPTLEGGIGANLSQSDWFTVMTTNQNVGAVVSSVTRRRATPILNVVNVAAPIKNNDTIVGYVILQIPTNNFLEFGYALSTGTYGLTYIVDNHGNVVAHPKYSGSASVTNISSTLPVRDLLAHQSGTLIASSAGQNENEVVSYRTVSKYDWGIVVQEPYGEAFASYESVMRSISFIEIVLLLIDIAISYLVFRFLTHQKDLLKNTSTSSKNAGFTLIELLVVIAIIAILSIVVVLTLNPTEMLRQSRDATRISDFSTLKSAVSLYLVDTPNPNIASSSNGYNACYLSTVIGQGTSTARCGTFINAYTNSSTSAALYRKNDSTGWLPVNFSRISLGTPLGTLPIDPVNNATYYYTYAATSTGGAYYFELNTFMESKKYGTGGTNDIQTPDGGDNNGIFETGNKPNLNL